MNNKWETNGLALEAVGLFFVLIAGAWQVFFNDWFDKQSVESFYQQSQDARLAILAAIKDTGYALAYTDQTERMIQLNHASDQIGQAVIRTFDDTTRRHALEKGQAETFKTIRFLIFAVGSLLVLLGKGCVWHYKLKRDVVQSVPCRHPVLLFRKQKSERVSDKPKARTSPVAPSRQRTSIHRDAH